MNRRNYNQPAPRRRPDKDLPKLKPIKTVKTPGRNTRCPCLSGKKFKACCKDIETLVNVVKEKLTHTTPEDFADADSV